MDDWNIRERGAVCSACAIPFTDKATCFTVLVTEPSGYQRQDFCRPCWDRSGGGIIRERLGVISYWQGECHPPPARPKDPLPREDAESLLRRLIERNDPVEIEARYILAVMLERKRILKHRETRKDGGKLLVYEHHQSGETFVIQDPQLRLDQLAGVQERVALMLRPPEVGPVEGAALSPSSGEPSATQ